MSLKLSKGIKLKGMGEKNEPISISLICATKDRYTELERLFYSLSNQTLLNFELIIVDQNEGNFIDPIIAKHEKKFSINHIRVPMSGLSKARNIGLKYAKGSWVGFPDDDCWMPDDFFEKITGAIADESSLEGIFINWEDPSYSPKKQMFQFKPGLMELSEAFHLASSICIYFQLKSIYRVNGFNEKLGLGIDTLVKAGEDQDLLFRLLNRGSKILKIPTIYVYHPIGKRMWNEGFSNRIIGQGACDIYFYRTYYGILRATKVLTFWILAMIFNVLRFRRKNYLWYYHKIYGGIFYSSKI
jgi:glycosyltransferase involved in cell wall biosynthesis